MPAPPQWPRREFLCALLGAPAAGEILLRSQAWFAHAQPIATANQPLTLASGSHLALDKELFEAKGGWQWVTGSPQRLPNPVLDSRRFGVTQPYLSLLQDPATGRFRIWYNRGSQIWHAESPDGIAWGNQQLAWDLPRSYGCSLIDENLINPGPEVRDASHRFKLANWQATRSKEDTPADDAGIWTGYSADGLNWMAGQHNPVLKTWPEGTGQMTRHGVGDTLDLFYDPFRRRYAAAVKVHALESDDLAPGPKSGRAIRRLVGITHSTDFEHWSVPQRILVPDEHDPGLFEFYGVGGIHARGRLLIGFARILRDDLPCDEGGPVDGIGYSVLVTSLDGIQWRRERTPFFDRNPTANSWDHAMSWIGACWPVGDRLHLYYGGYARGHKIAPETERQIGLALIPQDRYAGWEAANKECRLLTRLVQLAGDELTVNFNAPQGELRLRVLDEQQMVITGFDFSDTRPLSGDHLAAPVRWAKPLGQLLGKSVRIEFNMQRGTFFGFNLSTSS